MSYLDEELEALEQLSGTHEVAITFAIDEAGYLDRCCPSEPCGRTFKVLVDDEAKFTSEVCCIYCGHKDESDAFATDEQNRHILETVGEFEEQRYHIAMTEAARRTNAKPPVETAYATITETVSISARSPRPVVPPAAWDLMRLVVTCTSCHCRFAALGGCFFCPACGHRSPDLAFEQSIANVRSSMARLDALQAAVGKDDAAVLTGKLVEADMQTLVTVFEAFAKDAFRRMAPTIAMPQGVFQRLADGSALWQANGGRAYDRLLSTNELSELGRYFQQRHALAHGNGIVDQRYLDRSNDTTYALGQRIAVRRETVLRMAALVEKLAAGMREDSPQ